MNEILDTDLHVKISKVMAEVKCPQNNLHRVVGLSIAIRHELVQSNGYIAVGILNNLELPDVFIFHSFRDCLNHRTYFAIKAEDFSRIGPFDQFEIINTLENLDFVKE